MPCSHVVPRGTFPRLCLGTMTFGWTSQTSSVVDEKVAFEMVERCLQYQSRTKNKTRENNSDDDDDDHDISLSMDTARIYSQGVSERYCGNIASEWKMKYPHHQVLKIGTKAHPTGHALGLSPEGIQHQFQESCSLLQTSTVDEYYLHQPDVRYPLEDSLRYINQLVQQGSVARYGLSNYHVSEVQRAFDLCELHHWTKPSLYQGLYNPLNRLVEEELIPLLEQHDCSFVAYNPLAGGLLSGKYEWTEDKEQQLPQQSTNGRFLNNVNYIPRFYTRKNFKAMDIIKQACISEGLSMIEASFRWLLFHSALHVSSSRSSTIRLQHGLLLGASSLQQLDENLCACETAQPLSTHVLKAMDEAWKLIKQQEDDGIDPIFPYWRSYSLDMPNRDALPPGASYNYGTTVKT